MSARLLNFGIRNTAHLSSVLSFYSTKGTSSIKRLWRHGLSNLRELKSKHSYQDPFNPFAAVDGLIFSHYLTLYLQETQQTFTCSQSTIKSLKKTEICLKLIITALERCRF